MAVDQPNYALSTDFVVRAPLFSAARVISILRSPRVDDGVLRALVDDPLTQEAIFVASPAVHEALSRWRAGQPSKGSDAAAIRRTLLKYLIRMSTRATPFGLFAGCGVGSFCDGPTDLDPGDTIRRKVRLDTEAFCGLVRRLTADADVRDRLRLFPNSTLYFVGDEARFFEFWKDERGHRRYALASVEANPYLRRIAELAAGGALRGDLARAVADDQVTVEAAHAYIGDLLDNQVLLTELEPAVTDPDFLGRTIARVPVGTAAHASLTSLVRAIAACESDPPDAIAAYRAVGERVQVDVFRPRHTRVAASLRARLAAGLDALNRLTVAEPSKRLAEFRKSFYERFEEREVPLLTALDAEVGISYGQPAVAPAPLLADLDFTPAESVDSGDLRVPGPLRQLLPKLWNAIALGLDEVSLSDADFSAQAIWSDLPPTLSVWFSVVPAPDGDRILLHGAGGATAAAMIGRFGHLDKTVLEQQMKIAAVDAEAHAPDVVAEILHLPDERIGNVIVRPAIRSYEIPCIASPSVDPRGVVALDDLLISVPAGRDVRLRSKRLQQRIRPLLSNAHNYLADNLLPVYMLLCDLQTQGCRTALGLPADTMLRVLPRLPRITAGGCILSPAKWRVSGAAMAELADALAAGAEATDAWRLARRMPAEVLLADVDHELYLNLANGDCRDLLQDELKGKKDATFVEYPWGDANVHQIVAACTRG